MAGFDEEFLPSHSVKLLSCSKERYPGHRSMTYRNRRESMLRRKMQAGVTLVVKVWVLEVHRVVAHDALHEIEVVEDNGTA